MAATLRRQDGRFASPKIEAPTPAAEAEFEGVLLAKLRAVQALAEQMGWTLAVVDGRLRATRQVKRWVEQVEERVLDTGEGE